MNFKDFTSVLHRFRPSPPKKNTTNPPKSASLPSLEPPLEPPDTPQILRFSVHVTHRAVPTTSSRLDRLEDRRIESLVFFGVRIVYVVHLHLHLTYTHTYTYYANIFYLENNVSKETIFLTMHAGYTIND